MREFIDSMASFDDIIANIFEDENGICFVEFSDTLKNRQFPDYEIDVNWLYKHGFAW